MNVQTLSKNLRKALFVGVLMSSTLLSFAQQSWQEVKKNGKGTLEVYIQEEFPFAYYDKDELVGIEVDLLHRFAEWAKIRHNVDLEINFTVDKEFFKVFDAVKQNENVLGSASITITDQRTKEVDFSAPYLKNKSVLVSPLSFQTLSSYSDFETVFSEGTAVVIRETTHEKELMSIKQNHFNDMVVDYKWTTSEILKSLKANNDQYTMIDLLTFWNWVRDGESGLKVHRVATVEKEEFGFALSKGSDWKPIINEFFEGGFGFTASRDYLDILGAYLPEVVLTEVRF
jgi:putative glutamine transport system substrate-binding protein